MGKALQRIFLVVEEKGGLPARLRLVQATGITLQQAGEVTDKASLVKRVKKAAAAILEADINELLE